MKRQLVAQAQQGRVAFVADALSRAQDDRLWLEVAGALVARGHSKWALALLHDAPDGPATREAVARTLVHFGQADPKKALQRLLAVAPGNTWAARELAPRLLDAGDLDGVEAALRPLGEQLTLDDASVLGQALFGLGRFEDALDVVRPWVLQLERSARQFSAFPEGEAQQSRALRALHDELVAVLDGDEALTVDLALRGQLDAGSGNNHRLLARAMMLGAARVAPTLTLTAVEAMAQAGPASDAPEARATASVQRGAAALRTEDWRRAQKHFDAALEDAPHHFGAALGRACVTAALQSNSTGLARKLPEVGEPALWPQLTAVVPDWEVLTKLERRVVAASVGPLAVMLPQLAAQHCRIRVLPLDVRPTDLAELADLSDEEVENDHRSWEGIDGLAAEHLAVVKVEGLLDVSASGWVFAHEFAHLCELRLTGDWRVRLNNVYRRARKNAFAFEQYALRNVHEFFAVGYQHFLLRRYGLPGQLPLDDEGHAAALMSLFEDLGAAR